MKPLEAMKPNAWQDDDDDDDGGGSDIYESTTSIGINIFM
jgi:hypothetical protein